MATSRVSRKSVVLVLGMHRSGTSAVAAGLERLGVFMGSSLLQGDEWNPKGYFEEKRIVEFNNRLLELVGLRWDATDVGAINVHLEHAWAGQIAVAGNLLEEIFSDHPSWGVKDPRMCLLAPFWMAVLAARGIAPRPLMVLRDPAEVANSLGRRDGIAPERAAWLWFNHLLGSLAYIEGHSEAKLIDFADLLRSPAIALRGLGEWLGLTLDEGVIHDFSSEFISPQLSHGAAASGLAIPPLVIRAFRFWEDVAATRTPVAEALQAPEWREIQRVFDTEIKPRLTTVQLYFKGDTQLSVLEARQATLSRALAVAEGLALDRLDQILNLDAQLKHTSGALAFAEQLALERQEQLLHASHASCSPQEHAELLHSVTQLTAGLAASEKMAYDRLEVIERLDAQIKATSLALEQAEHCVSSLQADVQSLSISERAALSVAAERYDSIDQLESKLPSEQLLNKELKEHIQVIETERSQSPANLRRIKIQLMEASEALAHANATIATQAEQLASRYNQIMTLEALASQRQADMELLVTQYQQVEQLALQRQQALEQLEADLRYRSNRFAQVEKDLLEREHELSRGLSKAEHFAVSRLEQIKLLDQELKQTAAALAQAEALAFERLAELEGMRPESD